MRRILITLLLICFAGMAAFAQDNKRSDLTIRASEVEQPKSEVARILEEAKRRGEIIVDTCLKDCDEGPSTQTIDGFEPGRATKLPRPGYPPIARAAHAEGQVQVRVIIDFDGNVIAAHSISGHPLLQSASVQAAREAHFTPAKLNGQPVRVTGVIVYTFVLGD